MNLAAGKTPALRVTKAVGCAIETTDLQQQSPPTFARDIASIIYRNCTRCHRPGESAPFPLTSVDEVRAHAKQIAEVTALRLMPPWKPAPGRGVFQGERRLTEGEIQTLARWAAAGAPAGDVQSAPASPHFDGTGNLGKPDLVITLDHPYTLAASGSDVFRNFILKPTLDRKRYVRAVEIRPGNSRVVHHANLLLDRTRMSRLRDGKDGAPGFPGMDTRIETHSFDPESHFLFWKPGTPSRQEPEGMALELEPGTDLVLNMHLQPSGKPETLQPSVALYFTDQAPTKRPMLIQLERDGALDIPAGRSDFVVTDSLTLPLDVDVLGIYPHAHYLGKDLQAKARLPDGSEKWLIHIPDWDINWQAVYRYEHPVHLPKGTVVSMRYTYDNSGSNPRNPHKPPTRVRAGDRSEDEMAHLWLQVLPLSTGTDDARLTLQKAVLARRLSKYPSDFYSEFSLASIAQSEGKLPEAIRYYRRALATAPRDASAHNALGTALLESGDENEALAEFRSAVSLDARTGDAHYNIARVLLRRDQIPDAIVHLREALRIDPEDASAMTDLGAALCMTGAASEGMTHLSKATILQPESYNAHFNYGQALAIAGNPKQAEREFREALRLKPNDKDALEALRQLHTQ